MAEHWFLVIAWVLGFVGMTWLALAIPAHFQQVRGGDPLTARSTKTLRGLGAGALSASLLACIKADHPSMAGLVWLMLLAGCALSVAFALAWQPRRLGWLIAWLP